MKGVNVMIWHCVGREIIDEKSLNLTWVLDLEVQASHHYSIVNRQRKRQIPGSKEQRKSACRLPQGKGVVCWLVVGSRAAKRALVEKSLGVPADILSSSPTPSTPDLYRPYTQHPAPTQGGVYCGGTLFWA